MMQLLLKSATKHVDIVDDEASVRQSVARLLQSAGHNCRTFATAAEYLAAETIEAPMRCIVLDVRMPGMDGTQLQQHLLTTANNYKTPIVFISACTDVSVAVGTMRNGAVNFLAKPFTPDALLAAVSEAQELAFQWHYESSRLEQVTALYDSLTKREREVFVLVVQGLLNKQIAAELGIVEKTVKIHRARVMRKMAVKSVAELVLKAEQLKRGSKEE